jgi:putative tricarboxylic transport membrane protein
MNLHESHEKRAGEDFFGLIFLVVAVVLLWQAYLIAGFEALSSPGAFPLAAAAVMVLAALIVVIGNARRPRGADHEPILPRTIALFTGLVVVYAVALDPLGFLPASLLFLIVGTKLLYRRGWGATILISVLSLAVVYVIFRLVFQVVLPEGVVPEGELIAGVRHLFGGGTR